MTERKKVLIASICVGSVLFAVGLVVSVSKYAVFDLVLDEALVLGPDSASYPLWADLPVPIMTSVYVFNVMNPEGVAEGETARLEQVGPFVYYEYHEKVKVVWNDKNATVTYRQKRIWKLDKERSVDPERTVTVLNAPAATAAALASRASTAERITLSAALLFMGEKLFVTKTAREVIFDGYSDPLLTWAAKLPVPIPGLMDKFGIFYKRNGSDTFDGVFNMKTGADGLKNFGRIVRWNGDGVTPFFPAPCGDVEGGGDFFTPHLENASYVELYSNDLCRPLRGNIAARGVYNKGVKVDEFRVDETYFANSTENAANACYEGGRPWPSGVYNASTCRFGAPVMISHPHFYLGDPFYGRQFAEGSIAPNATKHRSYFALEPQSGLPVEVRARFQINLFVNNIEDILLFKKVREAVFPLMWFESAIDADAKLTSEISLLSHLTSICNAVGLALLGLGLAVAFLSLVTLRIFAPTGEDTSPILNSEIVQDEEEDEESEEMKG